MWNIARAAGQRKTILRLAALVFQRFTGYISCGRIPGHNHVRICMAKHIRALAILHIVYSALALLAGLVVLMILGGIGIALNNLPESEEMSVGVSSMLFFLGFLLGFALLLFALSGIIGGIGLMKRKPWARIAILVVSFFDLLHLPLGTALGVYTMWVLFHRDALPLFQDTVPTRVQG